MLWSNSLTSKYYGIPGVNISRNKPVVHHYVIVLSVRTSDVQYHAHARLVTRQTKKHIMNTQHTPGPWKVTQEPDNDGTFFAIRNTRGYLIATTATHDLSKEREANARLIAAAPELLDALRDCLAICLSRGEQIGLDDGGPVLDKVRTAIAKATQP